MVENENFRTGGSPEINIQTCGQCGREVRPGDPYWGFLCGPCADKEPAPMSEHEVYEYRRTAAALEPAENMALTIALAQIRRGDEVPPNTTAWLIFALARICRGDDA